MVKIELMNRHNIHAVAIYRQRYQKCRPCSLQSSSMNVSNFDERHEQSVCRNHRSQSQQGSWLSMVWKSHLFGPYVYVDKMKGLVESLLLMDVIICIIVTLLNDNWRF